MINILIQGCAFLFLCISFCFLLLRFIIQRFVKKPKYRVGASDSFLYSIAFFHPYCNAGGGGERVLWKAIQVVQEKYPDILCVVYTGDRDSTSKDILSRAQERFNISLPLPVQFVYLKHRQWIEAYRYPYFTLLGQSLGSFLLGMEALFKFVPDVYMDSMGYAFTLPLFKFLGGCKTVSYVHYPTISTDMLERVSQTASAHNNRASISRSPFLTTIKIGYYHVFAILYSLVGKCSDVVFVNSSWTRDHILRLWGRHDATHLVYPPCNTDELETLPISLETEKRRSAEWRILSVAQFRPEKNHELQIESFHRFVELLSPEERLNVFLVLVGSCRDQGDEERVNRLRELAVSYNLKDHVLFRLNVPYAQLRQEMEAASVGIHSMWNEHFGIGIVECMAGGVLMVAHDSGGPKMDIVVDYEGAPTGFLAHDKESYAQALLKAKHMPPQERVNIKQNARLSVQKFSEDVFGKEFLSGMEKILLS